jgi:cysteine desulfurase / selenocysteine lyase
VDVQALGCDWYVMTGHKLYGPTGIGALYGTSQALDRARPYQGGGEMIEIVEVDRVTYAKPPHRFEAGTPAIVEAVGLGAALTYMMQIGRDRIAKHEAEIGAYAQARLSEVPGLTIHGRAPGKGAIVSFSLEGLHPHDVATIIDRSGIAVRAGHHCAQPLMERLGVSATCRASFAMYNTLAEVDALAAALTRAKELFA